ncbi:WbqC family protein [Pontibacter sp. FD36]|uniref:WbqC family protein n=1 Tax=Pontibacter sp. FD36 TaxID=2789860 RepID=UPI0018AC6B6F|nr:WbqC family protein [Pontibacter sp. FD36]MBF8964217.1 WbqC family protein [Pontibacter sp. FD36]
MKIAIMQPYLFPYIGYFHLLHAVNRFIIYDDVTYIKQGWINRNNILVNGKASLFTVPLVGASSNKLIYDINVGNLTRWSNSFYKTIEQNYKKAPNYEVTLKLIQDIIESDYESISELCFNSLEQIMRYLKINTEIVATSRIYNNQNLSSQDRVLDICMKEQASHYINPIGGAELYSKEAFLKSGIKLHFIKSHLSEYKQLKNEFIPWLSIIDILMFNSQEETQLMLNQYELL